MFRICLYDTIYIQIRGMDQQQGRNQRNNTKRDPKTPHRHQIHPSNKQYIFNIRAMGLNSLSLLAEFTRLLLDS